MILKINVILKFKFVSDNLAYLFTHALPIAIFEKLIYKIEICQLKDVKC